MTVSAGRRVTRAAPEDAPLITTTSGLSKRPVGLWALLVSGAPCLGESREWVGSWTEWRLCLEQLTGYHGDRATGERRAAQSGVSGEQ